MMWYDKELPEFCPVRHLLAWLGMSKIRSGYFFPFFSLIKTMNKANKEINVKESDVINYQDYLKTVKNLCNDLLEREGKYGAHVGRKTGYLFATWSVAYDTDIVLSARHSTYSNAMNYKKDASCLLEIARINNPDMLLRIQSGDLLTYKIIN